MGSKRQKHVSGIRAFATPMLGPQASGEELADSVPAGEADTADDGRDRETRGSPWHMSEQHFPKVRDRKKDLYFKLPAGAATALLGIAHLKPLHGQVVRTP